METVSFLPSSCLVNQVDRHKGTITIMSNHKNLDKYLIIGNVEFNANVLPM